MRTDICTCNDPNNEWLYPCAYCILVEPTKALRDDVLMDAKKKEEKTCYACGQSKTVCPHYDCVAKQPKPEGETPHCGCYSCDGTCETCSERYKTEKTMNCTCHMIKEVLRNRGHRCPSCEYKGKTDENTNMEIAKQEFEDLEPFGAHHDTWTDEQLEWLDEQHQQEWEENGPEW